MSGQHRAPRPPSRVGRRAVAVAGSVALLTVAGTGTALACSPSESGSSGSSSSSTQATNASYNGSSRGASSDNSTSTTTKASSRPDPKFGRFKDVNADDDVNVRGVAAVSPRGNSDRSRVAATVRGLDPDKSYVALYYASSNCDVDGAQPVGIAARYRVSENGRGVAVGTAKAAINDIGSISVREQVGKSRALNDDDLVPKACARVR